MHCYAVMPSCLAISFKAQAEDLGHALLLHGDAIQDIGRLHRAAPVGDDDELRLVC